jgi:phenylacetate-coenzyme A ligase PaaK-like adenylate-forming protein
MAQWQVAAFNEVWRRARARYRFYADWQRRHRLRDEITHIDDLHGFPVLRSEDIEEGLGQIAEDAAPCRLVLTGGSSGRTRLFPRGAEDHGLLYSSMYLGRSWAGIEPGDAILSIWGHEHLFGAGAFGRFRMIKRQIMDWLIGTSRLNVYHLDEESVASYFDAILARPGAILIGYTSAIRKLLDFIEQSGADGPGTRVRAVIFCGETVTHRDLQAVRRLLRSVPLIEYGMQETGVMAYSSPSSRDLTFFWDAFHCWATQARELIITTLQPVRFPLINYGTEDRIEPVGAAATALPFRCAHVVGRTREVLQFTLKGGRTIDVHGEIVEDVLDAMLPRVRSYFIHQRGDAIDIAIQPVAGQEFGVLREDFLCEIRREFPDLDEQKFTFSALDRERMTIAGKRKYVLRE